MADRTVREFVLKALKQYNEKLGTDILSTKETSTNKTTSVSSSSTNIQYPSAKAVQDKVDSLSGSATIASIENNIVTIKSGISESSGIVSNASGSDISLHKVAKTGSPSDISVDYNGETVSLQTALSNIKTGIDNATSAGTQYIVSSSRATTPSSGTWNGQAGTLSASSQTAGKVYLVPNGEESYNQFITTQSGSTYSWTSLGSTTVDLSGVAKVIVLNGRQYVVSEGTTLVDLGEAITTISSQSSINNPNTSLVHVVSTTTKNTTTGSNSVSLEAQVKVGSVANAETNNGLVTAQDVKGYVDNKIIIRTWTSES